MSSPEGVRGLIGAACRGMDVNIFFAPDGEREPKRSQREARAKQICAGCPVLVKCREFALASKQPYGVWGGMTEGEIDAAVGRKVRTES